MADQKMSCLELSKVGTRHKEAPKCQKTSRCCLTVRQYLWPVGPRSVEAPVRPNMLKMPKSKSASERC